MSPIPFTARAGSERHLLRCGTLIARWTRTGSTQAMPALRSSMKAAVPALLSVLLLALPAQARGPSVVEEKGRIVLVEANGKRRSLTSSAQDSQPSLSTDGKAVVFVRNGSGKKLESTTGEVEANELWWWPQRAESPDGSSPPLGAMIRRSSLERLRRLSSLRMGRRSSS